MSSLPSQRDIASLPASRFPTLRIVSWLLAAAALAYALLAGLHTVQDFDLGWQLATGRWVVQHHHTFSTDVFSYTAQGQPWIYPALSGVIFYLAYLAGRYTLLSWLGALACAGTIALLLRRNSVVASALAIIAVPMIANRTQPRAEMFTTVLFAAVLSILWKYYRTDRAPLWLLPVLSVLWVNLHLGFVAGLALCLAYLALEALDLLFASKRQAALNRLRRAWIWLALAAAATLINPWGAFIYGALTRQQRAQSLHSAWLTEWQSVSLSRASLDQALNWRDPQSSFWWLVAIVVIGIVVAIVKKQPGAALLLGGSLYLSFQHVRAQALFACVTVIVAGTLFDDELQAQLRARKLTLSLSSMAKRLIAASALLVAIAFLGLATARSVDLVSNRYYMRSTQLSLFGTGLSWWYPERAVDFIQRENLPPNIFNTYSLGGYLTWKLFPAYKDYIDGRAIPFGTELFFRAYDLRVEPPDSLAWQQEAEARGINSIIVPLSRIQGMSLFPQLQAFCHSQVWRPVYFDEVSAIFVRNTPQTNALVQRLQIDCDKVSFNLPTDASGAQNSRARAKLFNSWANAAGVLYSLERYAEALAYLDRAQSVFGENAGVHLLRALVLQQMGRPADAEKEFRTSLQLEPSEEAWFNFGLFCLTQRHNDEAARIFGKSAESSSRPHELWMMQGQAYVQMHDPQKALAAFDRAVNSSPYPEGAESLGASFNSLIAAGRAASWYQLGDVAQAVSFQEEAVKLAPHDRQLWLGLADLYDVEGRTTKAAEARAQAGVH